MVFLRCSYKSAQLHSLIVMFFFSSVCFVLLCGLGCGESPKLPDIGVDNQQRQAAERMCELQSLSIQFHYSRQGKKIFTDAMAYASGKIGSANLFLNSPVPVSRFADQTVYPDVFPAHLSPFQKDYGTNIKLSSYLRVYSRDNKEVLDRVRRDPAEISIALDEENCKGPVRRVTTEKRYTTVTAYFECQCDPPKLSEGTCRPK